MVRKAKIQMEKEIAENAKVNQKKFWQYANSKRKTKSGIGELKTTNSNGEVDTAKTDKEKAEVLANFYSSMFTREPDGACQIQYSFTESKFEESEVRKLVLCINPNKSPGPDDLHPKALKELINVITEPLTIIFNVSKDTGIVPNIWKLGNIVALFNQRLSRACIVHLVIKKNNWSYVKTMSCSGSHLGITINIKNTKFVKDLPMIDAQFRFNHCNSFREEYISVFSPYGPVLIL
jgi:hypothetical protein